MSKRILVPLDGQESGEAIVPVVVALAAESGASVRLLRVAPVPGLVVGPYGRTIAYVDQEMARATADGLRDLTHIEAQFCGVPVESVVRFGDPAEEILLEAEAFDADLIALTTSRRSRLRTVLSAGVAGRVMRKASIPMLVLQVKANGGAI
jgi:nucleotide-binding universal stress UspA family protein